MRTVKKIVLAVLMVALLLSITPRVYAQTELKTGVATVTCTSLRLRERSTTASKTLDYASNGEVVIVLGKYGSWYHVIYNLQEGYMHKNYLSFTTKRSTELGYGKLTDDYVNYRSGPSTKYQSHGQLMTGDSVYIIGINSGWYKVIVNGTIGYIRSDYVELTEIPYENKDSDNEPIFFKNGKLIVDKVDPSLLNPPMGENDNPFDDNANDSESSDSSENNNGSSNQDQDSDSENGDAGTTPESGAEDSSEGQDKAEDSIPKSMMGTVKVSSGSSLRIRSGPGTKYSIVGSLRRGDRVEIFETAVNGNMVWGKIEDGWVSLDYVILDNDASSELAFGERVVDIAKTCLGVPYVWAGVTMDGFDCSGLIYYVFQEAGYDMPRSMSKQYDAGTKIEKSELRPGDIVFFKDTYKTGMSHVGIYVGNGQFIHAPSSGKTVSYANLNSTYWTNHYYGACRITNN